MKSPKKLQISSHLLFVYINNHDRKRRMSVLVFSSALDATIRTIKVQLFVRSRVNYSYDQDAAIRMIKMQLFLRSRCNYSYD